MWDFLFPTGARQLLFFRHTFNIACLGEIGASLLVLHEFVHSYCWQDSGQGSLLNRRKACSFTLMRPISGLDLIHEDLQPTQ
jgi:hypothetical protein